MTVKVDKERVQDKFVFSKDDGMLWQLGLDEVLEVFELCGDIVDDALGRGVIDID